MKKAYEMLKTVSDKYCFLFNNVAVLLPQITSQEDEINNPL